MQAHFALTEFTLYTYRRAIITICKNKHMIILTETVLKANVLIDWFRIKQIYLKGIKQKLQNNIVKQK